MSVQTQQHGFTVKTCNCKKRGSSRWRYVGSDIATVYFVFGPLWASPVPLSGPLMSLRLLLTILCCLPQYSSELHMGHRGERQRLPFISALIFLCDGWLSYCVICAFWKMLLGAEEITSFQIIQSSTVLQKEKKKLGCRTQRTIQRGLNYRGNIAVGLKDNFVALNKKNLWK